ncbi:MAG: ASCH domain-containing protein [Thermoprotei archaeon]|nr:MAG: ASCH domain-containing protein [Thermoprotei archaeon]
MFSKKYWDLLISGRKKATIRIGDLGLKPGDEAFVHCGGYVLGRVKIEKVVRKRLRELTDEDARKDGFKDKDALIKALKKHYPNIGAKTVLTIIEFEWIDKTEPVFSEKFAWKYELKPSEVAKLALEKCEELDDSEKAVLKLLVKYGSIRKTAIKLGGLTARPVVRNIVRKAALLLEKKGLIK